MAIEARDLQRSTEARFRQTNNAMRVAERQAHRLLTAAYGGTLERLYPLPETPGPNAPLMPHASAALRSPELNALLDAEFDLDDV